MVDEEPSSTRPAVGGPRVGEVGGPSDTASADPPAGDDRGRRLLDLWLAALLVILGGAAFLPGLAVPALFASVLAPLTVIRRSTGQRDLGHVGLVALALPLLGSLLWLLLDRPDPVPAAAGELESPLRRGLVLFLGFYLTPLVISSTLFARRRRRRRGEEPR